MNQKLAEARILAARKMPYMTHQVMTLIPVERRGLGTMAVDEYCRLYFDPTFLEGRDLKHPIPRVTVIVDTSGSMEESDLALALGVIGNALRSLPDPRGLRVLAGDTAVACAKNVFRPEQIELSGGGGTDMSAMIVAACEERPAPKAILVVTDGYTGWPPKPVGPRVMACLTQAGTADSVPKWIDAVVLNPED